MKIAVFVYGLAGIAMFILGGCASTYEESDDGGKGSGYSEKRLADGVYWLRFNGVVNESIDNVRRQWFSRADELCGENNYTASPTDKNNTASIGAETNLILFGVYAPFPMDVPYIEGKIECSDKALARQAGPHRYNPDDQFPGFRLETVAAAQIDGGKELEQQLTVFITRELEKLGVDSQGPYSYSISISVEEYVAEGWQSNWLLGGVSGGTYEMTSRISIVDPRSGRIVDEQEIFTEVSASGESAYRLKTTHAVDVVRHAVSVFNTAAQ